MNQPTLSIPKDIIEPIVQANIAAAVAGAMGPSGEILRQAVASILTMRVDHEGKPSTYGNNRTWIDWAIGDAIKKAARAAIEEQTANLQESIKAYIAAELKKKNSPIVKQIADGMLGAVFEPSNLRYKLTVQAEAP
ncbi:hypothetical protein [Pseudoxanthomonas winnipegensis]|uniref:hypothetical protein n=1 Tax=Pseudoxanthomonas winnipegensis TaxID=2480810 RepID=UPI00102D8756|nr:hypothetical protein [Pseudoxanthomonas winnipegensis]RZZ85656.1 hypothetical protein EA663_11635 [Pseudoxanthomonas winnipegensis]